MWLRIVCARRSASTSAGTASPTATLPRNVPRWTISPAACVPATRCVSSTSNTTLAAVASEAQHAAVADLAAALGVERRAIEHDLGGGARLHSELRLALGLELLVLDAIAEDRDDPRLRARRLVPDELGVAGAPPDLTRTAPPTRPRGPCRPSCRSGSGRAARPSACVEACAIDGARRTRPRARSSGRSGSRTCRGA